MSNISYIGLTLCQIYVRCPQAASPQATSDFNCVGPFFKFKGPFRFIPTVPKGVTISSISILVTEKFAKISRQGPLGKGLFPVMTFQVGFGA